MVTQIGAGPMWMPVNALLIRALLSFYLYYGDNFKIECPTGSGKQMNLFDVAREISRSADANLLARQVWAAACLRRDGEVPDRSTLEGLHSCSTSTSTETTERAWGRATRPVGLDSSPRIIRILRAPRSNAVPDSG